MLKNTVITEKKLKAIADMRMLDDTFMSAVFDGQIKETQLLLQIILNKDDIAVIKAEAQVYFSNIYGREIRLDILAEDKKGTIYNVEVQREKGKADPHRARFHGARVDSRLLKKGQKDFREIPDRYTIFITEDDMFNKGLPAYHSENTIAELNHTPLGDGSYIIYVNGQYRNLETPIGRLIHDFYCKKSTDILNPILRERVSHLKDTEGGQAEMCQIMDNIITEEKIDMAKNEIAYGELTLSQIARAFELPIAFVQELAKNVKTDAVIETV